MEMISDASLTEFKKLYVKRYGIELSKEEALKKANSLLNLYRAVYKPALKININNGKKIHNKNH